MRIYDNAMFLCINEYVEYFVSVYVSWVRVFWSI